MSAEASVALRIQGVGDPTLTFWGKRNCNGAESKLGHVMYPIRLAH